MGLFSAKIETYVSSTVYNLAGDENLRSNFLRTTVLGAVLTDNSENIGRTLLNAQLSGTGMRQRTFFKWAKTNYGLGMPDAIVTGTQNADTASVVAGLAPLLSLGSNESLRVTLAVIDDADVSYWAEDYIRQNHAELTDDQWSADYDKSTSELIIYTPSLETRIAAPADFLWGLDRALNRKLLFVLYTVLTEDTTDGSIIESSPEMFVYRMGTGNVSFDTMVIAEETMSEFFPVIPLRLNNVSVGDESLASTFAHVAKGYKKLTGLSVENLLEQIDDNDSVDDIDFAFLVQGVSLNVQENDCKNYLYKFFKSLMDVQSSNKQDFLAHEAYEATQREEISNWDRWALARERAPYNPAYQEDPPAEDHPLTTVPPINELKISSDLLPEFDFRLRWSFISETQHSGNARFYDNDQSREPMKVGEYWAVVGDDYVTSVRTLNPTGDKYVWIDTPYPRIFIFHQSKLWHYSKLELVGLEHRNFVYNDKSVTITAKEALEDEDESGFLVPLHYPTLTSMGLLRGTQMTSANTFIVFNSYEEVKIRWYQRGFFKILLLVASVAISVIFPPAAGLGSATGILGTNAAVGAAVGVGVGSAVTAAVVGAVVNGLAAMLLSNMIMKFSVKIFGDKVGAVLGTILSFVAMAYGQQFANAGNFDVDWSFLMRSENLLNLTDAVGQAYSGWLNADTASIYGEVTGLQEQYGEEMEKIAALSEDVLGMAGVDFDPMLLTESTFSYQEASDVFLSRTLLTGSDIAELTHSLIESFADVSLELPRGMG